MYTPNIVILQTLCWAHSCAGVLQDRGSPDLEGAVAAVRRQGDTATADLWQEALDNLTTGTPGTRPYLT